jgi:hypothetical protein
MATPTTLPASFVSGAVLTASQMNNLRGAFRVLQVVSTTKTDTFSTTAGTFVDVTGLSVSITPSSTSSKVFVVVSVQMIGSNVAVAAARLMRDSTALSVGDSAGGTRTQTSASAYEAENSLAESCTISVLDSPSSTSALTYKLQLNGNPAYVNRSHTDGTNFPRYASTITAMEISA